MAKKTDNANLGAKLALRRYFLRKYHAGNPIHVLECCEGSGVIWRALRREFTLASHWGIDLKKRKGRLKVDSARVLCQAGWTQNVIDIDTYGSPWKHWCGMLPHVTRDLTVFLTIGQWQMGVDKLLLESLDLGSLKVPPGIAVQLTSLGMDFLLAKAVSKRLRIIEAVEANSGQHAQYLGLRLGFTPN